MHHFGELSEFLSFIYHLDFKISTDELIKKIRLQLENISVIKKVEFTVNKSDNFHSIQVELNSHKYFLNIEVYDTTESESVFGFIENSIKLLQKLYINLNDKDLNKRESEDKFRNLFDSSPDAIFILDPKKGYIDANPAALKLFNIPSLEELFNLKPGAFSPEFQPNGSRSSDLSQQIIEKTLKNGHYQFEWMHKTSKGRLFPAFVSATAMEINGKKIVQGRIRDISDSEKAKEELNKSKEQLKLALKGAKSGLWDWNIKNNEVFYDENYYTIAGYKPNEYPHTYDEWERRVHPEDLEKTVKNVNDYINGKIENYNVEFRFLTKTGKWMWILSQGEIIETDESNNPIRFIGIHTDITWKKQLEEEQKQTEKNYTDIFNNATDAIYIQDRQGHFIEVNDAVAKMFGYPKEYFIGKNPGFLSAPNKNDIKLTLKLLSKAFEGEPQQFDFWGIRKNGEVFPSVVRCQNGVYKGEKVVITFALDITERIQAEEKLIKQNQEYQKLSEKFKRKNIDLEIVAKKAKDNEIYFKTLFKNAAISIQIFNSDGLTIDANSAWEKLWNTDFGNIKNKYNALEDTSIKGTEWYNQFCNVFKGQLVDLPLLEYDPADINEYGRKRIIKCVGFPIKKGELIDKVVLMHQDVTEKVLAENKLKESEAQLTKLFETMTEFVIFYELVYDKDGNAINYRLTDCNNAFINLLGKQKKDLIGKLVTEVFDNYQPDYLEEMVEVSKNNTTFQYTQYDSSLDKYFNISAVSTKKDTFVIIATDITAIKKMQEVVNTKNKELANFIYAASHDLRSPIINLQGFSKLLTEDLEILKNEFSNFDLSEEKQKFVKKILNESFPDKLDFIQTGVKKMNSLIDGLLKISRTGRENVIFKKQDVNLIINNVFKTLNYQIESLSVKVEVSNLDQCFGDGNLLNQLFSNLISNSIKFKNPDRNLEIKISSEIHFNKVIYLIEDNGIGISDFNLEKIWNVFYQVDSSNAETGEGIGLSIVKRIIEIHSGRIWVESKVGKFTKFYVELNLKEFN